MRKYSLLESNPPSKSAKKPKSGAGGDPDLAAGEVDKVPLIKVRGIRVFTEITYETFFSGRFLDPCYMQVSPDRRVKTWMQVRDDGVNKPFLSVVINDKPEIISPYKLRVNVSKNNLREALRILWPILSDVRSPISYFKVFYQARYDEFKDPSEHMSRLTKGCQLTFYLDLKVNPLLYAVFFLKVTRELEEAGIRIGEMAGGDYQISKYVSGRCAFKLDSTGAATNKYLGSNSSVEPSKDTEQCYLFLLARLHEVFRQHLNELTDKEMRNTAKKRLMGFLFKRGRHELETALEHYQLIPDFITEVIIPLERDLGKKVDCSEVTRLLRPAEEMPGYNQVSKPTTSHKATTSAAAEAAGGGGGAASGDASGKAKRAQNSEQSSARIEEPAHNKRWDAKLGVGAGGISKVGLFPEVDEEADETGEESIVRASGSRF